MYETWGLLPPIPRTPRGYRQFTEAHLDQMRLARSSTHFTWLGGDIRKTSYTMIFQAASGDLGGALEQAYHILVLIRSERVHAEAAAALLERWARGAATDASARSLRIGQVAKLLAVTPDMLRNWERNGLIEVPRNPGNGYRSYGPEEIGRLRVIRTLRRARYSTMAILRMLLQLDRGQRDGLRQALDTPGEDEDVYYAADHWLSTLAHLESRAEDLIAQLEMMIQKQAVDKKASGSLFNLSPKIPGGRAVVVGQFEHVLSTVLDCITPAIQLTDIRLVGTAAALLQGIFLPTRDINLLAKSRAQVEAFAVANARFPCLAPPTFDAETQTYAAATVIQGIEVGMAVVECESDNDGIETCGSGPWEHYTTLPCGAHNIPAVSLELRLATELSRARPRRYRPLLQYLRKHGCDTALLNRCLDARAIPQDRQQTILSQLQ